MGRKCVGCKDYEMVHCTHFPASSVGISNSLGVTAEKKRWTLVSRLHHGDSMFGLFKSNFQIPDAQPDGVSIMANGLTIV